MTRATVSARPQTLQRLGAAAAPAATDLRRAARRTHDAVAGFNAHVLPQHRVPMAGDLGLRSVAQGIEEADLRAGRVGDALVRADGAGIDQRLALGLVRHDAPDGGWADDVIVAGLLLGVVATQDLVGWPSSVLERVGRDPRLSVRQRDEVNRVAVGLLLEADERAGHSLLMDAERRALMALLALATVPGPEAGSTLPVQVLGVRAALAAGDPELVVAVGDLTHAQAVAWYLPGTTHGVHTLLAEVETAVGLLQATAAVSPDAPVRTAVVLDLYDAPDDLLEAALPGRGNRHAPDVRRDLADLSRVTDGARVTVIGHSYGSFAAGRAAAGGIEADALVLLGTPGVGEYAADDVRPLRDDDPWCDPADGVFVARAPLDPIVVPADLDEGVNWAAARATRFLPKSFLDASPWQLGAELSLGTDPADRSFGAVAIEVNDVATGPGSPAWVHGHSMYLEEGSRILENLARIIVGQAPTIPAAHQFSARVDHLDLPGPAAVDRLVVDRARGVLLGTDGAVD